MENVLPAALAFVGGLAVSFLNYAVTRAILKKGAGAFAAMPLRTLVAAAFVTALYFIAKALSLKLLPFMLAGALGMTAGLAFFTFSLIKGKGGDGKDG